MSTPQDQSTDGHVVPERARRRTRLLRPVAALLAAVALVVLGFTPVLDGPTACSVCHEIRPRCEAFRRSEHGSVDGLACLDCHSTDSPVSRLRVKLVGCRYVVAHLRGKEPSGILSPTARSTVETACVGCHGEYEATDEHTERRPRSKKCLSCHAETGHAKSTKPPAVAAP